jgi:hypothetical protein
LRCAAGARNSRLGCGPETIDEEESADEESHDWGAVGAVIVAIIAACGGGDGGASGDPIFITKGTVIQNVTRTSRKWRTSTRACSASP